MHAVGAHCASACLLTWKCTSVRWDKSMPSSGCGQHVPSWGWDLGSKGHLGRAPSRGRVSQKGATPFLAHSPETYWEYLKPTSFLGFGHREGAFEERWRWHLLPPMEERGSFHSPV